MWRILSHGAMHSPQSRPGKATKTSRSQPVPRLSSKRRADGSMAVSRGRGTRFRGNCDSTKTFGYIASQIRAVRALARERPDVLIDGTHRRSIWREADGRSVGIIDQTRLPHKVVTLRLATLADAAHAISAMQTRGAPLIGAVAAYGMCLALPEDTSDEALERAYCCLVATRPTAVTSNGRSTRSWPPCATGRAANASPPAMPALLKSARRTSRSISASAATASQ